MAENEVIPKKLFVLDVEDANDWLFTAQKDKKIFCHFKSKFEETKCDKEQKKKLKQLKEDNVKGK